MVGRPFSVGNGGSTPPGISSGNFREELIMATKHVFARPYSLDTYWGKPRECPAQSGITLREHYAGLFVQALIQRHSNLSPDKPIFSELAVKTADTLIEVLDTQKPNMLDTEETK